MGKKIKSVFGAATGLSQMDDSEAFLLPYLPVLQTCWIPPSTDGQNL